MRLAVTTSHWMMMKIITIINFEAFISTLFPFLLLAPFTVKTIFTLALLLLLRDLRQYKRQHTTFGTYCVMKCNLCKWFLLLIILINEAFQ